MNFVVSFAFGLVVGGITMWQMSRNNDATDGGEDSKAVPIEIINGESDGHNGEYITEEIMIMQENMPQSNDVINIESNENAAEEIIAEFVSVQEGELQSNDGIEEIVIDLEHAPQPNDVINVEIAEFVEAEFTEAEDTETPLDELQQIIGIGPTYAGRIYDAGIASIEELSKLTGGSLQEIVTPGKSTPTAETENWLEQARQLTSS